MNLAEEIINRTGLKTSELARYLGTGESHLYKHMAGLRAAPATAMPQLGLLYATVMRLPAAAPPALTEEQLTELQHQASSCRIDAAIARRKLADMQQHYQQASNLLQLLQALGLHEMDNLPEKKQRWLQQQEYSANTRLKKYNLLLQATLQVRIAALLYEADLYDKAVDEHK